MPDKPLAMLLAAPHSGGGKTTMTLALAAGLRRLGFRVHGCKCGPDYVDPTFTAQATGHVCRNLDTWLMGRDGVRRAFARQAEDADIVLVEGVMGLVDGRDPDTLAGSSLDVARVLGLPVLLVVHARGMARSIAPLVDGFQRACDKAGVLLTGVAATCTGSAVHRQMLEEALAREGLPPLLLSLERGEGLSLPSRQLGLVPAEEIAACGDTIRRLGESLPDKDLLGLVRHLERLREEDAERKTPAEPPAGHTWPRAPAGQTSKGRLAVARDEAFCFYYEDNFVLLKELGWDLTFFSPMRDGRLPPCDALYLGGGYPEVFPRELSENIRMRQDIRDAALSGLPVYAECGGFMYLAREIETPDGRVYPLCDLVPARARMGTNLRSLGYREVRFLTPLPFGLDACSPLGRRLRGHEFHWSAMEPAEFDLPPLYETKNRRGPVREGLVTGPAGNIQASYLHAYFPSLGFVNLPGMAESLPASRREGPGGQPPRLLLFTGPSSVGKTSLCRALSRTLAERGQDHVLISLDSLLAAFSRGGQVCCSLEGAERLGVWSAHAYHVLLREALRRHPLVLCDHVLCGRQDWTADLVDALPAGSLLAVELSCRDESLLLREEMRTDRPCDTAHAHAQAQAQRLRPLPLPGSRRLSTQDTDPLTLTKKILEILAAEGLLADRKD